MKKHEVRVYLSIFLINTIVLYTFMWMTDFKGMVIYGLAAIMTHLYTKK